ncbi:MAG: hypothetical protein AcusKO_06060 [Acuticoccus sp.]
MRAFALLLKICLVAGLLAGSPANARALSGLAAGAGPATVAHAIARDVAVTAVTVCGDGACQLAAKRPGCPAGSTSCAPMLVVAMAAPLAPAPVATRQSYTEAPPLTVAAMDSDPPPPRRRHPSA